MLNTGYRVWSPNPEKFETDPAVHHQICKWIHAFDKILTLGKQISWKQSLDTAKSVAVAVKQVESKKKKNCSSDLVISSSLSISLYYLNHWILLISYLTYLWTATVFSNNSNKPKCPNTNIFWLGIINPNRLHLKLHWIISKRSLLLCLIYDRVASFVTFILSLITNN